MPSLATMILSWPLVIKPLPLVLAGMVLIIISFIPKFAKEKILLLISGLILFFSPLLLLVLAAFSNM